MIYSFKQAGRAQINPQQKKFFVHKVTGKKHNHKLAQGVDVNLYIFWMDIN